MSTFRSWRRSVYCGSLLVAFSSWGAAAQTPFSIPIPGKLIGERLADVLRSPGFQISPGYVSIGNVAVEQAGDATLTLDVAKGVFRLTTQPITLHVTGSSHKGHGLDFRITLGSFTVEGPSASVRTSVPIDIVSQVRTCVHQLTGKKKVVFVKVTIVKPVVVEPFSAGIDLLIDVSLRNNNSELVLKIADWNRPRGSLRVGAIGDGPNAWGDIAPLDATHVNMNVNYVGVNIRIDNPVRKGFDSLRGKETVIPLKR